MTAPARILVVDDEPFNVDYLEQELEDLGYHTLAASNGREALDITAEQQPDMLLLDIMMPGMDGFEVLTRLKADEALRHIPVVIISAMSDMDSVVRGIQLGAEDYLPKPFDETLLRARIASALEKKHLRDIEQAYAADMEKELAIGHRIQAGFLPAELPAIPDWSLAAFFRPAREVAGDFYDVFPLSDGRVVLILGDVADKGVGAALFMALYRTLLRASLQSDDQLDDLPAKLVSAITRTNDYVCANHDGALFVTLFAAILDPQAGTLSYVNAGHNPPVLAAASGHELLERTGPALGMLPDRTYTAHSLPLNAGQRLFVYSDGLEDVKDAAGDFFGSERLIAACLAPDASTETITTALDDFRGAEDQYDDLTLLILQKEN